MYLCINIEIKCFENFLAFKNVNYKAISWRTLQQNFQNYNVFLIQFFECTYLIVTKLSVLNCRVSLNQVLRAFIWCVHIFKSVLNCNISLISGALSVHTMCRNSTTGWLVIHSMTTTPLAWSWLNHSVRT